MTTPIRVSIPHQLGRAEARRRIETGFSKLASQLPGGAKLCNQSWEGDRLAFSLAALTQTVSGSVEVLESTVTIEIELPGLLGQIAGAFKDRLQKAGQLLLGKN
jgi:putative polyhydroxyalkanoate system protein